METRKEIIFYILVFICLIIFVFVSVKPNLLKSDEEKISEYLQNKYSEQFTDIEFLSSVQNEENLSCDGSILMRKKVKDSYKHYYKAYSKKNDIEFYVYIDKTKNSESIADTYSGYLTKRSVVNEIISKTNMLFGDLIDETLIIRDKYGKNTEMKKVEELNKVIKKENEYTKERYEDNAYTTPVIYFKINMNYNELIEKRRSDIITLNKSIKNIGESLNAKTYTSFAEVQINTSDGYKIVIDGINGLNNTVYIDCYNPQNIYTSLKL